jgi:hypothetical protein
MRCQFCKQDVDNPCHNTQEMQQRASSHIPRCEKALKSLRPGTGIHARDIQRGGRH